ncbi:MAG: YebC/PmpR family DNA-binding transcriptional regulator [Lysobacteraceae bacterium]|nr:MAG: YebC/PmpR family DNA-binding transcriptional regulator [Xanthomonadaceae bacterium]
MGRGPSIEARKNAEDARRGKIFTKIIREISVAARAGGGDPGGNPRLRSAIDKGLAANMTKDVIERAIRKATGELEGVEYEEIRYEGYAPGGVAVIVDCLTDNRVRTVADVRHAFGKFGGNMGTEGSVAFMFRKLGVLSFDAGVDEERLTEAAIEAGADDVVVHDNGAIDVLTAPESFAEVKAAMDAAGFRADIAELAMRADNDVVVEGETAQQVAKLLRWLEDMDDVQAVHSNADLGDAAYA